jgi:hypothetical protein
MISILKKPKIDIEVKTPSSPLILGNTISIDILISPKESFEIRSGLVEFTCTEVHWQWVSHGKSSSVQKVKNVLLKMKEQYLDSTHLIAGTSIRESVNLLIPANLPPTVKGKIVDIRWQIKVSMNVIKLRDVHQKCEVPVLPAVVVLPRPKSSEREFSERRTKSSGTGELSMSLDSEITSGNTLYGALEIIVKKTLEARAIRVQLEVKESAGAKSSKRVMVVEILENKTTLVGGGYRKWKFSIKVPAKVPSTYSTEKSSVKWTLKGIIDKCWKRDFTVSVPIQVY